MDFYVRRYDFCCLQMVNHFKLKVYLNGYAIGFYVFYKATTIKYFPLWISSRPYGEKKRRTSTLNMPIESYRLENRKTDINNVTRATKKQRKTL